MERLNIGFNTFFTPHESDKDSPSINYIKIMQLGEQLMCGAKQASQGSFVAHDEMERLCQVGDLLNKEIQNVRNELIRRKNFELLLPSPNTQKHLPCSNLLAPPSSPPPSASVNAQLSPMSSSSQEVPPTTTGATNSSMTSSKMQIDSIKKFDPKFRAAAPMYVNLTEQMILAQSNKRKRVTEGVLFCHNCKTKDTPEWRRGPMGAKTLCNACGIRWRLSQGEAKHHKRSGGFLEGTLLADQPIATNQVLLQQQQQQQQQQPTLIGYPQYVQVQNPQNIPFAFTAPENTPVFASTTNFGFANQHAALFEVAQRHPVSTTNNPTTSAATGAAVS